MDLVICHDYGPFMLECNLAGGHITWLENPGRNRLKYGHWKERYIGRWPAMHRIKAGHFTQRYFIIPISFVTTERPCIGLTLRLLLHPLYMGHTTRPLLSQ